MKLFFVWVAYLKATGYGMDEAIWINIDETPIPYHFGGKKGLRKHPNSKHECDQMRDKTTLAKVRSKCTMIASIASDTTLQQCLPQVLLPNAKGQKKKWKAAQEKSKAYKCVRIMEGTTGWITNLCMKSYLRMLKKTVSEHAPGRKIVLMMDAHACHHSIQVLRVVHKWGWRILMIPSKLTYLLQPLDAYVFAQFKRRLHEVHMRSRIDTSDGNQSFEQWVETCFDMITTMFQHIDSKQYFLKCGCSIRSHDMNDKIWKYVENAHLGLHRKFSGIELRAYMGVTSAPHLQFLFPTSVPEATRAQHIYLRAPTHRLSSKRSLSAVA